ncbi:MAG TPA: alpha/beta hydrolase [Solirubrobacteraceae bacterium]|nr:alpha/beta hydrolase [Solirubrobacteraceae bacterium]
MESTHISVGRTQYAVIEQGDGPLLLFGHGTFGAKELFEPQIEQLSHRFRCVAFDWPGHGGTSYNPDGWTVAELVEDVPELIDALGAETAYLAGVSQGGAVFMRVALRHPERARALINMCGGPGAPPPNVIETVRAFARTVSEERDEGARRAAVEDYVNAMFHAPDFAENAPAAATREVDLVLAHPREGVRLAAEIPASYVSIQPELSKIACPTLVIWGEYDLRPHLGAELAAAIPGAKLATIAGGGHHVNVDQPAAVSTAIEGFLDSLQ